MILLRIREACKQYGPQILLDNADAEIFDDRKIGLIGRNGAGKSTLIRAILGEEELDSGAIENHPKLRLGYLRQHDPFEEGESALQFLMRDSGQEEWRCGMVGGQFELKGERLEGPVKKLSGGWQTRVKLAALLLHDPNLLVLDEPTNFLDLRTQLLLEEFLKNFQGGCLIVSHDRRFLKNTCTHTLELSRGVLTSFPGDVEAFLVYKEEQRAIDERSNATIKKKREQLETFIAKNRAHANTASQAASKSKQLEKLQIKTFDKAEKTVRMKVPDVEARSGPALRCMDATIGYEDPHREIATNVSVELNHGARAAVVGDNGQGKTTFLRSAVGSLPLLAGEMRWGHGCDIGCYAQHVYTSLPEGQTVQGYLNSCATPDTMPQVILDMAGSFLFRGDDIDKPLEVLSGGERARLCMAGLLLSKYNVLILDEPGNHLDVDTVESLSEALQRYKGTVLFTSHDRTFLEKMATSIIEVRDGRVTNYHGDYQAYLYRVKTEIEEGARDEKAKNNPRPASKPGAAPEAPVETDAARKERNRKIFELKKLMQPLERQLAKYGERKNQLEALLPTSKDPKVKEEHIQLADKVAAIEEKWMALQGDLEQLEGGPAK